MRIGLVLAALLILSGCEDMSPTQQRTLSSGAVGAGGGALIGALAGNAGLGAVIGGGAGLAGGYLWDRHRAAEERAFREGMNAGRFGPPMR